MNGANGKGSKGLSFREISAKKLKVPADTNARDIANARPIEPSHIPPKTTRFTSPSPKVSSPKAFPERNLKDIVAPAPDIAAKR